MNIPHADRHRWHLQNQCTTRSATPVAVFPIASAPTLPASITTGDHNPGVAPLSITAISIIPATTSVVMTTTFSSYTSQNTSEALQTTTFIITTPPPAMWTWPQPALTAIAH
nr:unnamed protein product [Spirometra erinaceieuropaei]